MRLAARVMFGAALMVVMGGCGAVDPPGQIDGGSEHDAAVADARERDAGTVDAGACPAECGAPTACSHPACNPTTGECDPGYTTAEPADQSPGDCQKLICPGTQAEPVPAANPNDVPGDLPCSDRSCSGGEVVAPVMGEGVACIGEIGVCDGVGGEAVSCRTCRDNVEGAGVDAGCTAEAPSCDEAAAAGEGACVAIITPTTWDPTWSLPGINYANGNLSISSSAAVRTNVRTAVGKASGKYYWEVTATGGDGVSNHGGIGILESVMPNDALYIGYVPSGLSFGYGACCTDQYWYAWEGVTVSTAPPPSAAITAGIVYMFALDMDTGTFWAGQNGAWYNGGDPASGAVPVATGITGTVYPGVTFYVPSINSFTANFGGSAFLYPVPAGFTPGFY